MSSKETIPMHQRSQNVAELLTVLMDINKINGGDSTTAEKMKVHAKSFEAALFEKSSSKEEYQKTMKSKIDAMRSTRDKRKRESVGSASMMANLGQDGTNNNNNNNNNNLNMAASFMGGDMFGRNQSPAQNSNANTNLNTNVGPGVNGPNGNDGTANPQMFMNQQAQARQQAAARQLKNRQMGGSSAQQQQLTQQQQQLLNQMRVAPIPKELLQHEQRALLQEAMEACKNFQKTHFGGQMSDANKQAFIKKFINSKALKKLEAMRMAQGGNNNANLNKGQADMLQRQQANMQMNQQQQRAAQNQRRGPVMNDAVSQGYNNQMNSAADSTMNNSNQPMNIGNNGVNMIPNQSQQQQTNRLKEQTPQQPQQRIQSNRSVPMLNPTPEDVEVVRRISAEAAKTQLRLTDLTNSLTPQERDEIKKRLQKNQQLFAQVSSYAPQVYLFTKSESFLKEVLQLRIFIKEILEKCSKGIYVVKLDTVDKLVIKYQKYWESMKIQLLRRQQLLQQQQQQQQQQGMDPNRAQNSQQQQQQNQANMQQARNRKPTKNQTTPAIAASVAMNMNDKGASMSPALQKAGSAVPNFAQQMSPNMTPGTIPPTNVLSPHSQSHIPMVSPTMAKAASAAALKNDTASSSRRGSTKPRGKSTAPVTGKKTSNAPTPQVVPATVPSTTNLSAAGTPNIRNKSATPLTAGLSPKSTIRSNSNTALASAKTPSPMTVSIPQPGNSSVFKKEEEYLSKLQLRKEEIRFRQKQRLDILSSSPVDLFLTTVADCLGINDEEIELINKIPETTADNINNTGKKKLTKAAQKLRDKEILNVSIQVGKKDKLIMSSKAPDKVMNYSIGAMSLAAVFKNLSSTGSLNNIALSGSNATTSKDIGNIYSHTGGVKRKFDEVEISPNSNGSPSASIMSESKKIKIDSPEDMFVTHSSEAAKGTNNSSLMDSGKEGSCKSMAGSATEVNDTNIWDWNFWTSIE
ncbi:Mediator of RNA polymerase II transcription subunit 15 [Nakaseomyces glabratus]|uniref:Mediator of RNA polymerase II transcription subunit 15 n=1 Tax=Candida glabrata TaxID=5478 RepID=A0A0W0CYL6_CANGB|nr:Mediator of RNA polymerase II transcription subunit 15 [Nakaseomyces glabratus]KTB10385.1 Mediator of RNA polymerase II transcription subunit 15 [Nakaseomyces glabratus]KTB10393.1 Mediator of RNA polymerase II transcription subunit 15 [Nakaseomyces glabratus]KTB20677.1 Mediator of RNA polymerase II transcription subunit 15 [Nakaseomyces glabratus]